MGIMEEIQMEHLLKDINLVIILYLKKQKRLLLKTEHVHHKNKIRDDNRLENLEIVVNKNHFGEIKCPHCQKTILLK